MSSSYCPGSLPAARGVYPTMITPYNHDGSIDCGALDALVEWYWRQGCGGIFASCQSSEIFFLSEDERVLLARRVKAKAAALAAADKSRPPLTVVASGHVSDSSVAQIRELRRIADTGVDAVILISNRLDIQNTGDAQWIAEAERLVSQLPAGPALGVYECPMPYKRLLSPAMLRWCAGRGFRFIKDTCCDATLIAERLRILAGSKTMLFNANAQTLLASLCSGAAGYCGVMANFHPALYAWLCRNFESRPEFAAVLQSFLCLAAFTESLAYPCTAKYHLAAHAGIAMEPFARSRDCAALTDYQKSCIDQMTCLADLFLQKLPR